MVLLLRRGDAMVGIMVALEDHFHSGLGLGKEAESMEGSIVVEPTNL